jgi:hypothetical protein
MFYANISLSNPWFRASPKDESQPTKVNSDYRNLWLKHGRISKYKYWEAELILDKRTLLKFEFSLSFRGRDHAGIEIGMTLLGYDLASRIYDIRHWDYQNDQWEEKKGDS